MTSYIEAKTKLINGDYSQGNYFAKNNYLLEYAYNNFLQGNKDNAFLEFAKIRTLDIRADWAWILINLIDEKLTTLPSYFQIRNFLEIDMNLLIMAGQAQYIENILNCSDIFYSINPESYKFIARVMKYNDFNEIALFYLLKGKDKFYEDPEMHFMLANLYLTEGKIDLAKQSLRNCLNILPEYTPARKVLLSLT